MAQEVDADRALTAEQNWSAREHRELYEAVHTGNEPGRIGELAREWTRLGVELGEAADTATRRMRSTEQGWQGAAADAARTALQRVLDWSRDAGATAHSVGDQLDHQGRIMEAAKTSMPEPVEPDPGPKRFSPDGPKDLAGLAGAVEDGHARQERSRAAHDQAVEVMRRMEADSRQVDGSTPRFEPPPNPIEDSAPAPKAAGQDGPSSAGPPSQQAPSQQASPVQQPDGPQPDGPQPDGPHGTAPSAAPAQAPPAGGAPAPGALGPDAGRPSGGEQGGPAAPTAPVASKVDGRGSGKQGSGPGGNPGKKDRGESKSDGSKGSKDSGKDDSGGKKSDGGSHGSGSPKSTHSSSSAPPAEQTARLPKPPTPEGGPRSQSFSPAAGGAGGAGWSGSLPQPPAGAGSSGGAGASGGAGSSAGGGRGSGSSGESLSPGDRSGSGAARGSAPTGGAPSSTTPAGGGQAGASGMTGMAGSPGAGMAGRGGQGQQEQSHSSKYVEGDEELFEVPGDPPPPVIGARKQERQQGRGE